MATTIAVAGKGGVGKTSIAGLIIKYLVTSQTGAVLAIDADPSSNLNMVLGLDLEWTVGDIREDMLNKVKQSLSVGGAAMGSMPGGMSKRDYLNYEVHSALSEGDKFDLIAMGRSEGQGCYCAVNHNLREVIDSIGKNYRFVVIDNEAGMEHLSRRTTRDLDHLFVVSDPTIRGIITAERIAAFRHELDIRIENTYLILNRLVGTMPDKLNEKIKQLDIPLIATVPADDMLTEFEYNGRPLVELSEDSPVYSSLANMLEGIIV
jgi:CO dehydrogenase maturation factor